MTPPPSREGSWASATAGEARSSSLRPQERFSAPDPCATCGVDSLDGAQEGHRGPSPRSLRHFLKGVSLLKVCQNSDGFLLGSARANTCCCGRLAGTVTWRWWTGRRLWSGGAEGHPPP